MPPRIRPPYICPPCLRRPYSTHLPPHPLPSGSTKLTPTRTLIEIHGIDAPKYLQGVTTTDIPSLTDALGGAYSTFLTAQGRVLFDVFIYPTNRSPTWRALTTAPSDPSYFIECDATSAPRLIAHIKRYKLRSKFTVRQIPPGEWDVWSLWDDTTHPVNLASHEIDCVDHRAPGFGKRAVLPRDQQPALSTLEAEVPECGAETYRLRRYLHGVPEGQGEILEGVALPAESCVDYMGGVDFRKGCYVGQELTIRTHHQGIVRKRILPVVVYPGDVDGAPGRLRYDPRVEVRLPPGGTDIKRVGKKGRAVGKWLAGVGNVGLALCRLEMMTDVRLDGGDGVGGWKEGDEFAVEWEGEGNKERVKVKAFVPGWHLLGNRTGGGGAPVNTAPATEKEE